MNKEKISSFWDSYKITLEIAREKKYLIKKATYTLSSLLSFKV